MKTIAAGAAAGVLIGALVLVVGVTAAAWIALTIAVVAITAGAVEYVRTHQ